MCDSCGKALMKIFKLPCAYYIEKHGEQLTLVMPIDEEAYSNICLECISGEKELL
jgi:hypothetical protein